MSTEVRLHGEGFAFSRFAADDGYIEYRGTRYVRGPRQALLRAGRECWADDGEVRCELTADMLGEMARNARERWTLIPVNYDHLGGTGPDTGRAAGVVLHDTLEVSEDGVLSGLVAYTEEGARQVRAGERPGISAEFSLSTYAKDEPGVELGAVLRGVALLTTPQQHDLVVVTQFAAVKPLDIRREVVSAFAAGTNESRTLPRTTMDYKSTLCSLLGLAPEATDEEITAALAKRDEDMKAADAAKATEQTEMKATRDTLAKLTAERDALRASATAATSQATDLGARVGKLEAELFDARCAKALDDLAVTPGDRERGVQAFKAGGIAWEMFTELATSKRSALGVGEQFRGTRGDGVHAAAGGKTSPQEAFVSFRDQKLADGSYKFGATAAERHLAAVATAEGRKLEQAMLTTSTRASA